MNRSDKSAMPGFPWKGQFKTKKEINEYFSNSDAIQCLLCGQIFTTLRKGCLCQILQHSFCHSPRRSRGLSVGVKKGIDTSAYTAKQFPAELIQYMKTNGKKQVLFKTNYPMITPAKCLEDLDGLGLSQEARDLFLYINAKSLFDI